ncbi:RNA polymerase sigma-70 factor, ECF subfamily [Salegentibacter holothuriorum]|uniref:RNA polymerase sigma factor n=2 Tax=Salegentibacter holothuriorum TaxID=241145 RepID=A0A1T5CSS9_9FLAO|nr:RNA polymerase sigma-70 factor, ECF subfamily [Salegentibacter holothuriorum]
MGANMFKIENNNDLILVEHLKNGDEASFQILFNKYQEDIYYYAKSLVKIEVQAEEIVQDVFIKVWVNRHLLEPEKSFKAFIFTITRNLAFNFLKKAANDRELISRVFYESQKSYKPTDINLTEDEYKKLSQRAVTSLPPRCQLIFKMSREEGKSYEEISNELNISANTVKNQMTKALGNIREFLSLHGDIVFSLSLLYNSYKPFL